MANLTAKPLLGRPLLSNTISARNLGGGGGGGGGGFGDDLAITVRTTSPAETFEFRAANGLTPGFDAVIDWGDGSTSTITSYNDPDLIHTYAAAGDHQIRISGAFPSIAFSRRGGYLKIIRIDNMGNTGLKNLNEAFYGCANLTEVLSNGNSNTSGVTDMTSAFHDCDGLTTLDLTSWDVSSVTQMNNMFNDSDNLVEVDLSNWDTSSVTSMYSIFSSCNSLTTVKASAWDVSSVTNFNNVFRGCASLITVDVSTWDVSSVRFFNDMFYACTNLTTLDVSNWDTASAESMSKMFYLNYALTALDVSNWNMSSVTNIRDMVRSCIALNPISISGWDITSLTNGRDFMNGANNALTQAEYDATLIAWEAQAYNPNVTISFGDAPYSVGAPTAARAALVADGWNITDGGGDDFGDDFAMTVRTTSASEVFTIRCSNYGTFDALIDWGDGSSSTITSYNDSNLNHTYLSPADYQVRISGAFPTLAFDSSGGALKVIRVDNMGNTGWLLLRDAFKGCRNLTEVLTNGNVDTSSVLNMSAAFKDCNNLTTCDVSGWDTSSNYFINDIFRGCTSLLELDVSTWDTSLVNNASNAFAGCWVLTTLDVSGWDTSSIRFMSGMFSSCFVLNPLTISGWDITTMTSASNFMNGANNALTQAEYDATLIAWEAQAYNPNVTISFGDATYSAGAPATARAALVADGWNITDGGEA